MFIFILIKINIINLAGRLFSSQAHIRTQTHTHRGIDGWINASQASLASSCICGKTGKVRQEPGDREEGGLDKQRRVEREREEAEGEENQVYGGWQ